MWPLTSVCREREGGWVVQRLPTRQRMMAATSSTAAVGGKVAGIRGVGKARIVSGPFYSHFLVMKKLAIPALARALRERSSLTRC